MREKVNVTLYLDKALVKEAKQSGFNLSKLMENTLRESLNNINSPRVSTWNNRLNKKDEYTQFELVFPKQSGIRCRGRESNPRPLDYESNASTHYCLTAAEPPRLGLAFILPT